MTPQKYIIFFICGALGALTKDVLKDNSLVLPRKQNGMIVLGFIGGTIIGGAAGIIIDENPINAFTAGFAGTAVIENLVNASRVEKIKKQLTTEDFQMEKEETIPEMITRIAKKNGVDPNLAIRVAKCESGLNPNAVNENTDGTTDRGLYQINDYWHSHITDEQAFNPVFATQFFCDRVNKGKLSDWDASRECWDIK